MFELEPQSVRLQPGAKRHRKKRRPTKCQLRFSVPSTSFFVQFFFFFCFFPRSSEDLLVAAVRSGQEYNWKSVGSASGLETAESRHSLPEDDGADDC